jgi:alkanesulfonate monooxygenase
MTIEFIGMIQPRQQSEIHPASGPGIDPGYLRASAQAHDAGGFDRILIGWHSNGPDGFQIAAHAAAHTQHVGFLVAHRPGFGAPTVAARAFATLDQLSGGRAAIHVISGGDDTDQARDGDFLGKDARYARTDEYLDVLKAVWTGSGPVDHEGAYYRIVGASPELRTVQRPRIPIYFGGASDAAVEVAGKHADVYALWGETQAQVRETIGKVRAAAAKWGRSPRFSLSLRPVLAETEEAAWRRADEITARTREVREAAGLKTEGHAPPNVGAQRLLDAAAQGSVVDKRLWTGLAALTGASGNSTGLVGTPEQVAEALLDYWDLGVSTFLIRGFDPLEDAVAYGRDLIPLVRDLVARREAEPVRSAG